eukprot:4657726-Pleurochrysis_carterae.AAC.1
MLSFRTAVVNSVACRAASPPPPFLLAARSLRPSPKLPAGRSRCRCLHSATNAAIRRTQPMPLAQPTSALAERNRHRCLQSAAYYVAAVAARRMKLTPQLSKSARLVTSLITLKTLVMHNETS